MMLITALAVVLALACAASDIRERRIPNNFTYPAAICGVILHVVLYSWQGLVSALAGGLLFGGVFFLFYLVRTMGAGDVKLAAALGFIVGLPAAVPVMLATAISGGILAAVVVVCSGRVGATLWSLVSVVGHHLRFGMRMHPEVNLDNPKALRMPYGAAFAAGTIYWATIALWR
jgi:Flp pilus assembly protein protease CpaA